MDGFTQLNLTQLSTEECTVELGRLEPERPGLVEPGRLEFVGSTVEAVSVDNMIRMHPF